MAASRPGRAAAMKLALTIDSAAHLIEILAPAPACRFQMGDSPERSAQVETPEPGVYSVLLDGRSYDAYVDETPNGLLVSIEGYRFEIAVDDPRRWSRKAAAGGGAGVQT